MFGLDQNIVIVIVIVILFIIFSKKKENVEHMSLISSNNKKYFYLNKIRIERNNNELKKQGKTPMPINLGQIKIYNICNQNIAPDKKVNASSIHPEFGTEYLTNGQPGTFVHTGDKPLDIEFFEIEVNSFISKITLGNRTDCCGERSIGLKIYLDGYLLNQGNNMCDGNISSVNFKDEITSLKKEYKLFEQIIDNNKMDIIRIGDIDYFISGEQKNTGFNDEGKGNTVYLDRHNINCIPNGIRGFKLVRDGKGQYRYDYICSNNGNLDKPIDKNTDYNDDGKGNLVYLDRHNIDCGKDLALAQFKLSRNPNNQYRYDYKCEKSLSPLQCRKVSTDVNQDGKGNATFLDRHNITCNEDEVISQFKLTRPDKNLIKYDYTCCKYNNT